MCAICGFAGTFDPLLLATMSKSLRHRGPDDRGEVVFGKGEQSIGLAHRRLAIIDLSREGRQPITTDCPLCREAAGVTGDGSGLWLTYNGEIYNHRELRRELEGKGHRFH